MNVTNCKGCGRLFNVINNKRLCPNCVSKLEDKFQEVKKYLTENPNSSIEVVSQDCEVSAKQIKEWVREERLAFTEGSVNGIECEHCGAPILTGRFCDACRMKLQSDFRGAINTPAAPSKSKERDKDKDRMRFLQKL